MSRMTEEEWKAFEELADRAKQYSFRQGYTPCLDESDMFALLAAHREIVGLRGVIKEAREHLRIWLTNQYGDIPETVGHDLKAYRVLVGAYK